LTTGENLTCSDQEQNSLLHTLILTNVISQYLAKCRGGFGDENKRAFFSLTCMKHLSYIVHAILAMSGRVDNALDLKVGGKIASNRTIQRLFYRPINWPTLLWVFLHSQFCCAQHSFAIAGDEVVTSRAGKHTHGVDWFVSAVCIAGWQVWAQQ
jgi:hypothetical protein